VTSFRCSTARVGCRWKMLFTRARIVKMAANKLTTQQSHRFPSDQPVFCSCFEGSGTFSRAATFSLTHKSTCLYVSTYLYIPIQCTLMVLFRPPRFCGEKKEGGFAGVAVCNLNIYLLDIIFLRANQPATNPITPPL